MIVTPLPHGGRRYALEVYQGEYALPGFGSFVVELTPQDAFQLLERVSLLKAAVEKDPHAYELYFWDCSGNYLDPAPGELEGSEEPCRTECDQLVVRCDEVCWMAYPKHGDVQLTTEPLPFKDILEIAGTPLLCRPRR